MDFKVGDVVTVVGDDECPYHSLQPDDDPAMLGHIFKVVDVDPVPVDWEPSCIGYIRVAGKLDWYCTGCFRHLPKASEEFTAQMRNLRPVKDKVNG